jgi:CubicO group peptidase (beta-lactamase class C family)
MIFGPLSSSGGAQTVDSDEYSDPQDRFSVPIPTNWTAEEHSDYTVLTDPDGELTVSIAIVPGSDARTAVEEALTITGVSLDDFSHSPDVQSIPSEQGVDETIIVTYLSDDQTRAVQAVNQRVDDQNYIMIFAGSLDAAAKRNSQIQIIADGFTITRLETTDLTDVARLPITTALLAELDAYIDELLARLAIPGASVAIVDNGNVVLAKGYGVTEIGGTDPVTADTQMMIGSTTKSMTTLMMATEVDDGLMTWDQPVVEILPEFAVSDPELTQTITVRNLVCACTGMPRRDMELMFNASDMTAEDVISSLSTFALFTGFGEAFQYSNQMVATGGYVAAAAAGGSWGDLYTAYLAEMQTRVFDPIGMSDTTFSFEDVESGGNAATPHGYSLDGSYKAIPVTLEELLTPIAPAGAVWSTANDMARYLITQMQKGIGPDGNRVVSEKNLTETWIPQVAVDAETDYGLGWLFSDYHGIDVIAHGGNTLGFSSDLAFLPNEGIGIVVLANGQAASAFTEGIRNRLFELMYDLPPTFDTEIQYFLDQNKAALEELQGQIADVPPGVAGLAIGTFRSEILGDIEFRLEDGELILDAGEFSSPVKYIPQSSTDGEFTFITIAPPVTGSPFTLRIDKDGARTIEFDFSADRYEFSSFGGATPAALPADASPVAA